MSVLTPPRPPAPEHPQREVERRRAQEALIKEARRRARQRRQRSVALLFLGAFLAMAVGSTHVRGGYPRGTSSGAGPAGSATSGARNGKIAFADDLGQLQVIDPDGSGLRVIARCPRSCPLTQPTWSPNGRQIAYIHYVSARGHPTFSLYLEDADSGRVRHLTRCGICGPMSSPGTPIAWSPDGALIAFSRESSPRGAQSLWLVDTATGRPHRLTDCQPEPCSDISPAWAPNGQLIVFSRIAGKGTSLYTVRPNGSQLTQITNSRSAANPQWSPDGRRIAYDGGQLFVIDADGSNPHPVFAGKGNGDGPGSPSWSPDGTKIAFFNTTREPNEFFGAEVWIINPDGTGKKRLYDSACCVTNYAPPIWSPDGQKLAFATRWARAIFVIDRDGSNLHRISNASTSALSWQRLP